MKVLRDPLVHFALLGAVFFAVYAVSSDLFAADDSRRITIDESEIEFLSSSWERQWNRPPTEDELRGLVEARIREEVLYREALSLNLDQTDYVIKRRMIQKLDFIAEGFAAAIGRPTEAYIQNYYDQNKGDYFVEPWITFTHVFFDRERLGAEKADELAKQKFAELNQQKAPFTDAVKHGSRFLYHTNYVERSADFVASHFGWKRTSWEGAQGRSPRQERNHHANTHESHIRPQLRSLGIWAGRGLLSIHGRRRW